MWTRPIIVKFTKYLSFIMSEQFRGKLFLKSFPSLSSNDTSALGKPLGFIDQKRFVDPVFIIGVRVAN